jgi:UDP-N-acetylmuramoyl-tripeptide--D-alanyl-D-alanine ligase
MISHSQTKQIAQRLLNKSFFFDSRICTQNSVFIALETGERSGMDFIQNAIANGAKIVISQKAILLEGIENILVENCLAFIQDLAKCKFEILQENGIKTICLTGSVGKTTTKELIAATLSKHGKTHATQGNYNNHIGVPITVLNCPVDAQFLVLEMGMNHANEIAILTEIAPCQFRLITNVGNAHTENFDNGITGVLHAKFEILKHGNAKTFILENLHKQFLADDILAKTYQNSTITPVKPEFLMEHKNGQTIFTLSSVKFEIEGIYSNAQIEMFCLAIALINDVLGQKINKIFLPQIKGRGNIIEWRGIKIINDSYNANPLSMANSLENFKHYHGKKLCILGEMRELGENSRQLHKNLESLISGFDGAFLIGEYFTQVNPNTTELQHFENYKSFKDFLILHLTILKNYDTILVKASNGMLLWKLFDEIFI